MAVIAPEVKYYEYANIDADTNTPKDDSIQVCTKWDAGIVDAGTDSKDKVLFIWNANGEASDDHSDMQNVKLGVVSNETGHQGNKVDKVYEKAWCHAVLNAHDHDTEYVALGRDQTKYAADGTDVENTLALTAVGLDESDTDQQYRIKGTKGTSTLDNGQTNYAKVTCWISLDASAAAGQHKFRLRTTYSYT